MIKQLVGIYSKDDVIGQLRQLYQEQIGRIAEQIGALLPRYRARVDEMSYTRVRGEVQLLLDGSREEVPDVQTLEATLKRLIEQQRALASVVAGEKERHERG